VRAADDSALGAIAEFAGWLGLHALMLPRVEFGGVGVRRAHGAGGTSRWVV
jgi:hypothetical protein